MTVVNLCANLPKEYLCDERIVENPHKNSALCTTREYKKHTHSLPSGTTTTFLLYHCIRRIISKTARRHSGQTTTANKTKRNEKKSQHKLNSFFVGQDNECFNPLRELCRTFLNALTSFQFNTIRFFIRSFSVAVARSVDDDRCSVRFI